MDSNFSVVASKRPIEPFPVDRDDENIPFVPEQRGYYPTPPISRAEGKRIIDEMRANHPEAWA